jgi:hypothetical protein
MMDSAWQYIRNNKFITILNIDIILILLLPYSETYGGGSSELDELTWSLNYFYQDMELFVFFIPLSLLTIGFQIMPNGIWRKLLLGLLILLCCGYSFIAFIGLGMPIQDYAPTWGQLVMVTVGPLMLIIWGVELNKSSKHNVANIT